MLGQNTHPSLPIYAMDPDRQSEFNLLCPDLLRFACPAEDAVQEILSVALKGIRRFGCRPIENTP